MRRIALLAAVGALAMAPAHADEAAKAEARVWLERMAEALTTRNYDGLFTHTTPRQSEAMRIVHRSEGGRTVERLVSLDGSGREIIRTPEVVHCYFPDRRMVLVEPNSDRGSLIKGLPAAAQELDANYDIRMSTGHRLLGVEARLIEIRPRDAYRYGYRLWLDEKTAMPLRSAVCDANDRIVEQIHFTRLDVDQPIAARDLEPAVDPAGFRLVRSPGQPVRSRASGPPWQAARVPPGFRLIRTRSQVLPGADQPVQHLVYSDGMAVVSVFIEAGGQVQPAPVETTVGSASAFSATVGGIQVTAVGEVPPSTVRIIATSVGPGPVPASGSR